MRLMTPLALCASCGGEVSDRGTSEHDGGQSATQAAESDCESVARDGEKKGCLPADAVDEMVSYCVSDSEGPCGAEAAVWTHCFATHLGEVTSCFGDGSAPPSCNRVYCDYCWCGGPCTYDFCQ